MALLDDAQFYHEWKELKKKLQKLTAPQIMHVHSHRDMLATDDNYIIVHVTQLL